MSKVEKWVISFYMKDGPKDVYYSSREFEDSDRADEEARRLKGTGLYGNIKVTRRTYEVWRELSR